MRFMEKKHKYSPVTQDKWDEYYNMWIESGKSEKVFNRILLEIEPYLDMCKKSFKVRPEYWDEYHCVLLVNIWRAFTEFKPERGARFSTWVYRLASQSAWGFIKDKCKDIDRTVNQIGVPLTGLSDEINSVEDDYINDENIHCKEKELHFILNEVLRGPIEKDVFIRKYGLFGKEPLTPQEISAELSLTPRTVEQVITRNNNSVSVFKRWLREQGCKKFDSSIIKKFKTNKTPSLQK